MEDGEQPVTRTAQPLLRTREPNSWVLACAGRTGARIVTLALILLLPACSTVQLGYNSADALLRWRGDQYFDFQGEQSDLYAEKVGRFMRWHRANALPEYVKLAEDATRRIERGLSRDDLVWGYDTAKEKVKTALGAAAGEVAGLLDQLGPAQFENLERRLARDNRDFAKEQLEGTPDERRKKRVKRTVERLEDWVGDLGGAQIERVRLYSARAPLIAELRDQERRQLQRALIEMLKAREARARLADFAIYWERNRTPEFDRANRSHLEEVFSMLLDLDRTLTPAQREKAAHRMRALATDFAVLAREPR